MDITVMMTLTNTNQMMSNGFQPLRSSLIKFLIFCILELFYCFFMMFAISFTALNPSGIGNIAKVWNIPSYS